jgi:hypothetical protein
MHAASAGFAKGADYRGLERRPDDHAQGNLRVSPGQRGQGLVIGAQATPPALESATGDVAASAFVQRAALLALLQSSHGRVAHGGLDPLGLAGDGVEVAAPSGSG